MGYLSKFEQAKPTGKKSLERLRSRQKDNIIMFLKEIGVYAEFG